MRRGLRRGTIGMFALAAGASPATVHAQSVASSVSGTRVFHVDGGAVGLGDGTSWDDAYTDLQDALDAAEAAACSAQRPCEIWVAQGVYKPSRLFDPNNPDDPITPSFVMRNHVGIYGGFTGWETRRGQRDWEANETILSGDHNDDDDPSLEPLSNCCLTTRDQLGCDNEVCRQIVINDSLGAEIGCTDRWGFTCAALARFLCCDLCRPSFCDNSEHVLFGDDTDASAILDGVTVMHGEAFGGGGGLVMNFASPTIANCTFLENRGVITGAGSGAFVFVGDPSFTNCRFVRNFSWNNGGAGLAVFAGNANLTDCTFLENTNGAMIYDGSGRITRCRFVRNTNRPAVSLAGGAPVFIDCEFIENSYFGRGAGLQNNSSATQLINCDFLGNTSGSGGALDNNFSGTTIMSNCVFSGNRANFGSGGAITNLGALFVRNSTVVGNTGSFVGGFSNAGAAQVDNSIFWGNTCHAENCSRFGQRFSQITSSSDDPFSVNYTVIEGLNGSLRGEGNVDIDPMFVNARGDDGLFGTEDNDFHLSILSEAIDGGDPMASIFPFLDHDGHARKLCGRLDMGAFEFGIGDYNCDYIVDLADFSAWDSCMTGPDGERHPVGCEAFDFHAEAANLIDLLDFAGFQRTFTGDARKVRIPERR